MRDDREGEGPKAIQYYYRIVMQRIGESPRRCFWPLSEASALSLTPEEEEEAVVNEGRPGRTRTEIRRIRTDGGQRRRADNLHASSVLVASLYPLLPAYTGIQGHERHQEGGESEDPDMHMITRRCILETGSSSKGILQAKRDPQGSSPPLKTRRKEQIALRLPPHPPWIRFTKSRRTRHRNRQRQRTDEPHAPSVLMASMYPVFTVIRALKYMSDTRKADTDIITGRCIHKARSSQGHPSKTTPGHTSPAIRSGSHTPYPRPPLKTRRKVQTPLRDSTDRCRSLDTVILVAYTFPVPDFAHDPPEVPPSLEPVIASPTSPQAHIRPGPVFPPSKPGKTTTSLIATAPLTPLAMTHSQPPSSSRVKVEKVDREERRKHPLQYIDPTKATQEKRSSMIHGQDTVYLYPTPYTSSASRLRG
ncbi:hypothetical protein R3P38DRAFT_3242636 [Favolaschia claudopus]|uniref:Uncharacterized protein n=1 Tax=Favolaschia claudopus TaxID=2862362 RepID=A0AAV9Z426_9AGAR